VRSLEVGTLNLLLGSLKSLTTSLHSGLPDLLTRMEDMFSRGRKITGPLVASLISSALHLLLALHNSSLVFMD
jgi:hypothetical protein